MEATISYKNRLLYISVFFVFLGFYVALLVLANANLLSLSRYITIPIRLLIVGCLIWLFLKSSFNLSKNRPLMFFLIFASLYLFRIMADNFELNLYYLTTQEHLFYFFSFCFLPFLITSSLRLVKGDYDVILRALLLSAVLFSAFASVLYRGFVGTVGRLIASSSTGEAVISPLILSYCSTLAIGVCLSYMLENKVSTGKKAYLFLIMGLSIIPFFLGASRGSIFALFLPFVFVFASKSNVIGNLKLMGIGIIVLISIVFLGQELGSKLIDRIVNVSQDIETQSTSVSRLDIWKQSLSQFSDNPIAGDSFRLEKYNNYPHNVPIEVLQTTGILGFIPFIILIGIAIVKCFRIFKYAPQYSWLGIIFLQTFVQSFFSGGIHSSSWFWFSMGLVIQFTLNKKVSSSLKEGV